MTNKKVYALLIAICFSADFFAQEQEDAGKTIHVAGSAGLTNNGISLIPNFSLGDPAALFNLSVGKQKLSFETDFNFSLEGKPWYILYWLRYKVVDGVKFKMGAATHLGLNFKPVVVEIGMKPEKMPITERYWVAELFPRYLLTRHTSLGIYYMHSRGLDPGTVGATHFVTLNANFSHIGLFGDFFLGINPQIYYLKQDKQDGFYLTSTFTLGKDNFPVSLSSLMNHEIRTDITAGKGFVWNIGARYSFNR